MTDEIHMSAEEWRSFNGVGKKIPIRALDNPLPEPVVITAKSGLTATLYRADCLAVLPTLGKVDAVITDPPYGIGLEYESHDDNEADWYALMNTVVPMCRAAAAFVVMPSCRIRALEWWYTHHKPDWLLAWYKGSPGHVAQVGFNDWEPHLTWGKPPKQMHDYWQSRCGFTVEGHPCPKPVEWASWLVQRAANKGGTVADPFVGSGTTGVAALRHGCNFIGVEIEPKYFAIAERRIRAEAAQGKLF